MNKLSQKYIDILKKKINEFPFLNKIINEISKNNGRAFLVGGAVRDLFLRLPIKDLDIEVHGLNQQKLEEILKSFGPISLIGKIFGVYRVHGLDIDWSLPRIDTSGRKPQVSIDPFMSIQEAFRRRDLTINSMGVDLINFELIDPFNGYQDLKNKILRATDPEFFLEDPLRFFRVMQFVGRFQMFPDEQLNQICAKMDITKVSVERIEEEFKKLFLKSKQPSLGIEWLNQIGRLKEVLPEIYSTIGIPQELEYHPEGDVYEHSKQALDAAASLEYENDNEKLILLWTGFCHDLGKISTTEFVDGRYRSYGHEIESERLSKRLLKRITRNIDLIETVARLVKVHMQPVQLLMHNSKPAAYKRLAARLAPYANMNMLSKLIAIDRLARNPQKGKPLNYDVEESKAFLKKIKDLNIEKSIEKPILKGQDIFDIIEPGPQMGKLLKKAYEIQIDEGITDKEELKKRIKDLL